MPTTREAIRIVTADGWQPWNVRGSHRHFKHPVKPGKVTIPGKLGDELAPGTWKNILRQAGLAKGQSR
ncbi:type II toxin-antitoxin system HicA family toxin [Candidatus Poriferisodalis sp.]|uniref:type II toxin-antitoxin system HicA family toxin n=1 Tax=Candidatus Poriferisodalis sp. TaxID=3101277 RepID=UPI003B01A9C9